MSDTLSPEDLERIKARDNRFRQLDLGIEVEAGLRDSRPLQVLMERLRADADRAMVDFATANPADIHLITGLQARVFRFSFALETLSEIIAAGRYAETALTAEDAPERVWDDPNGS